MGIKLFLIPHVTYPLNPSMIAVFNPAALAVKTKWSAKKPIWRKAQLGTGLYSGNACLGEQRIYHINGKLKLNETIKKVMSQ